MFCANAQDTSGSPTKQSISTYQFAGQSLGSSNRHQNDVIIMTTMTVSIVETGFPFGWKGSSNPVNMTTRPEPDRCGKHGSDSRPGSNMCAGRLP